MRGLHKRLAATAILLVFAARTGLAAEALAWSRTASPDGSISAETPCSPAEIELARRGPSELTMGVTLEPSSRVVCFSDGYIFVAGVIGEPALPAAGPSLYDLLTAQTAAQMKTDPTAKGTPTQTTINGRRAYLNREETPAVIAQTGLIEVDRSKIIFVVVGGQADRIKLSKSEQVAAIDHFSQSIQATGK